MEKIPSSYRDPAGFVFTHEGKVYRYISPGYEPVYTYFTQSGLYAELAIDRMILRHRELDQDLGFDLPPGRVLLPDQVSFISYPYEWSFDMWKDAALLTLRIAFISLEKGMMLKDATPFNIQFQNGQPVFIDTLSFELYKEGSPWVAYRQFCESFLGPLLLMKYGHPGFGKLFMTWPDGIPLDELVKLLPRKARYNLANYLHIYLQASFAKRKPGTDKKEASLSRQKLQILLNGLLGYVSKMTAIKAKTTWDDYYLSTITGREYLDAKTILVKQFLQDIEFDSVIDLGANDGHFSKLLKGKQVVTIDSDPNCINGLYLWAKEENASLLPLVIDLAAPSPAIGFANKERNSITERLKTDLVMALALIHHLAIGKNISLPMIAGWLSDMSQYLLIEFVPKEDEKVQLLLQNREDIFSHYSADLFREAFGCHYAIMKEEKVGDTDRILFLLKRK